VYFNIPSFYVHFDRFDALQKHCCRRVLIWYQSNNISAAQIQNDYQERLRQAEREAEREQRENGQAEEQYEDETTGESPEEKKKRKRKEAATLAKIKQSKEFARRKARKGEDSDDDEIARDMMYQKSKPLPGQLDNCEICEKRFTVTPYSKTGPDGGLLCAKCSKELAKDEKKAKPKKTAPKTGRRQNQSKLLDGIAQHGASTLVEMCTKVCQF
jgi:DNA repair protein RAD7